MTTPVDPGTTATYVMDLAGILTAEELAALNEQRASLSREIRLLKTDPDYVEKVIRQRLNYVRKNEILYLFDKNRQEGVWSEKETEGKR